MNRSSLSFLSACIFETNAPIFGAYKRATMTPTTTTRLEKYFETCASYTFLGITSTGVYVKFTFGTGAKLTVFATNAQLEPFM